jgi:hypothetical protein
LGTNLLSEIIRIRAQNEIKFHETFNKVACDENGMLKKAILYNSFEIQPQTLNQLVIEKLDQGDMFTVRKIKTGPYKYLDEIDNEEEDLLETFPIGNDPIIDNNSVERVE